MGKLLSLLILRFKRILSLPWQQLNRSQKAIRYSIDLGRFGARQLQHDRAGEMAAALAFRTLFGLLPVLVVTSVLVKAMDMHQHIMGPLDKLFQFWGLDQVRILVPDGSGESATPTTTLAVWLRDRVREAESVNIAAIGWVGVLVTIYAALSLVVTIEECFNVIYRAPQGRSWSRRIPIYWFFLTLSPLMLLVGTTLSNRLELWQPEAASSLWLSFAAGLLWSLGVIWVLMFAVYWFIPNTKVHVGPALIGSFISSVFLELGKRTLGLYLENALSLSQLYGSLGLIPLFMFWVYMMWLAVLFGLQVSSTLQHSGGRQLGVFSAQADGTMLADPLTVLAVMVEIASKFQLGKVTDIEELEKSTGIFESLLEPILERLTQSDLIHAVNQTKNGFVLAAPPGEIRLAQVMDLSRKWVESTRGLGAEPATVRKMRLDQIAQGEQRTLLDLLDLKKG